MYDKNQKSLVRLFFLANLRKKWYDIRVNLLRGESVMDEQENVGQTENLDGPIQEDKLQNENLDRTIREDSLQNEKTIRGLAIAATVTFAWILIWALVLKLGSEIMLVRNY